MCACVCERKREQERARGSTAVQLTPLWPETDRAAISSGFLSLSLSHTHTYTSCLLHLSSHPSIRPPTPRPKVTLSHPTTFVPLPHRLSAVSLLFRFSSPPLPLKVSSFKRSNYTLISTFWVCDRSHSQQTGPEVVPLWHFSAPSSLFTSNFYFISCTFCIVFVPHPFFSRSLCHSEPRSVMITLELMHRSAPAAWTLIEMLISLTRFGLSDGRSAACLICCFSQRRRPGSAAVCAVGSVLCLSDWLFILKMILKVIITPLSFCLWHSFASHKSLCYYFSMFWAAFFSF